jgi:hypothetical protein
MSTAVVEQISLPTIRRPSRSSVGHSTLTHVRGAESDAADLPQLPDTLDDGNDHEEEVEATQLALSEGYIDGGYGWVVTAGSLGTSDEG